jgi:hypothetical protein
MLDNGLEQLVNVRAAVTYSCANARFALLTGTITAEPDARRLIWVEAWINGEQGYNLNVF